MSVERFDVFVIGGGGTGSEVAFSLARRGGTRVALAERDKLGGECNHYGCVPTKIMLRSARVAASARDAGRFGVRVPEVSVDFEAVMRRAREIIDRQSGGGAKPFEDVGVKVYLEEARLVGPHEVELASGARAEASKMVMATGTEATAPPIPGLAGAPYWTNREAIWAPKELPSSLVVLGSGPIGIEFAQVYARFGAKVTVVEVVDRILPPEDADSAAALVPALEEDGIAIRTGAKATRADHGPEGWRLAFEDGTEIAAEQLLVATGRRPCFDEHDLEAAGVRLEDGKPVLTETLRTTAPHIWAAGDATGELLFTHVGGYEAEIVVEDILGHRRPRDYRVVPKVTFCEPEVASVGLSEDAARAAGHDVVTSLARIADNERALIDGQMHGIVKLVADARGGELLGGHIVAEGAGEMIHEVVAAMAARAPVRAVAEAIHAYPTLSESLKGAFLGLADKLGRQA